jgi:hypothetical protein
MIEEVSNKPVNRDAESATEEVDEDHDLARIGRRDILAQSASVT